MDRFIRIHARKAEGTVTLRGNEKEWKRLGYVVTRRWILSDLDRLDVAVSCKCGWMDDSR